MNKYLLGFGGIIILGLGAYAGLSNKEPAKYSIEWIKKLTDKEWEIPSLTYAANDENPKLDEFKSTIAEKTGNLFVSGLSSFLKLMGETTLSKEMKTLQHRPIELML